MNIIQWMNGLETDKTTQLFFLLAAFGLLVWVERLAPRRPSRIPKPIRWTANLGLTLLNYLILILLVPSGALLAAIAARNQAFGFFNWMELPPAFVLFWTVLLLDITLYYQHRVLHAFPRLWKIHRVHHADLEVDATTAFRFHPVEILLSWLIQFPVIFLFGFSPLGVFLFQALRVLSSLFNHSNLRLGPALEKCLRAFLATPDMHRIHHSQEPIEADRNFGFIFSFWDKLFGTYQAEPQKGQEDMALGLAPFNDPKFLKGDQLLLMPFMDKEGRPAWKNFAEPDRKPEGR